ncbi:helicase SEN1 [Drosophila mauritiana]|uniref:Helicase SEN1 n=1 Tax=Drosophila mauritiana TaxID=7226 RepID=A0A6P8JTP4_DROMA|nr:helicase SEN1 [Drosophila mauritiana]XP_033159484.1 helicase SEN1 [Drosophila mauritiana]
MSGVWYLEHVTTGARLILHNGTNSVGRHSRCRIILGGQYQFVSREHANIIISEKGVEVQSLNPLNGLFINGGKLGDKINRLAVAEGSTISLGVTGVNLNEITGIHAVFILKKKEPAVEEIVLSSDEDDTTPLPAVRSPTVNQPTEFNLKQQIPNFGGKQEPGQEKEVLPSSSNLHLPKLTEVKQEIVKHTSEEIQNIFGEPSDAILNSVLELNPYLYNKLTNKTASNEIARKKIHDGDCIELDTDPDKRSISEAQENEEPSADQEIDDEEEYDESFAMSQAVIREMKAEMHVSDGEEDFLLTNGMGNLAEGSPSNQAYDDIVYISDSDDEELYDKVADWSKLLSQKVVPDVMEMSQTYPVENEQEDSDSDLDNGAKKTKRTLRILSSSDDDSADEDQTKQKGCHSKSKSLNDHVVRQADSTTPDPPAVRKLSVPSKKDNNAGKVSSTADVEKRERPKLKSCLKSPTSVDDVKNMAETKNSSVRQCQQTVAIRKELTNVCPQKIETNKSRKRIVHSATSRDELATTSKEIKDAPKTNVEPPKKKLRNRSKSCYVDRPVELDKPKTKNEVSLKEKYESVDNSLEELIVTLEAPAMLKTPTTSKTKGGGKKATQTRGRRKTIHCRDEIRSLTDEAEENKKISPAGQTNEEINIPTKSPLKRSARLLNRSKSCYMDRPVISEAADPAKKVIKGDNVLNFVDVRQTRGPAVIEAPSLPKNRGKLRGVSAEVKVKDKVLDRQRFIDYQAEINAKWKQKPKDKKKEDEKLKECRREALKKLTEKPKENTHSSTTIKRKKPINVPTVQNSNRGAFLTKGVDGPAPKLAKTDNAKPPAKKPVPKQPPTIETFSQQLQAADEAILHPQPQCSRPVERKEAELARNQRTCNKVTFAEMELYHQKAEESKKLQKKLRKVHFNDDVKVHCIERVKGASSKVQGRKECIKLRLSSYRERREWIRKENKPVNDIRQHSRSILKWANQWLKHGSVDAVAEQDVLMPIPQEFDSFKNYREIFVPLMKLELLSTIERDYKINNKNTFSVGLINVDMQDGCYRLVTRVNSKPFGKFVLYTLYCCGMLNETFANLLELKCVSGNVFDLTFEILKQDISEEKLKNTKQLTARPVVDSLRVELGALSAVHQLRSSPLCRRILKPTQAVNEVSLPKQPFTFKGCHKLNEHQESIVLQTYQRIIDDIQPSLTLIQGPPGTGKSKVISELCLQTMYGNAAKTLDRKILICAHSNTAVDHIVGLLGSVLRVMNHDQFHLLRFGMHEKMSPYSRPFSLEAQFSKAKEQKLKRVSKENAEFLKKQHIDLKGEIQQLKEKTNLTSTYLLQQLHQKEKTLQLISNQLSPPLTQREEFEISQMCVTRANIICTTLSSCVKLANYVDFFDICIVDEATQCTEPWTLLPMRFGLTHMVLVGDMQQLPAVVLSKKAIDFGLSNSMFDRIQRSLQTQLDKPGSHQLTHTKLFKLSMQYRMHPEICRWPNKYFYEDQLINANCTARFGSPLIPYCVINLKYTRDSNGAQNKSISNNEEAGFVAKLLTEMDKHMPSKRYSYGIISPYQNQCYALSQVIPSHMNITPQTVDSYQGLEKDVIIISNARTRGFGFLTNYQRLNVALTRPRRCLVICGNFEDLKSVEMWRNLLDDARKRKVYFNLDRDDVNDLERSLIKKMMVNSINLI